MKILPITYERLLLYNNPVGLFTACFLFCLGTRYDPDTWRTYYSTVALSEQHLEECVQAV